MIWLTCLRGTIMSKERVENASSHDFFEDSESVDIAGLYFKDVTKHKVMKKDDEFKALKTIDVYLRRIYISLFGWHIANNPTFVSPSFDATKFSPLFLSHINHFHHLENSSLMSKWFIDPLFLNTLFIAKSHIENMLLENEKIIISTYSNEEIVQNNEDSYIIQSSHYGAPLDLTLFGDSVEMGDDRPNNFDTSFFQLMDKIEDCLSGLNDLYIEHQESMLSLSAEDVASWYCQELKSALIQMSEVFLQYKLEYALVNKLIQSLKDVSPELYSALNQDLKKVLRSRDRLVQQNLRLVLKNIHSQKYVNTNLLLDFIQDGNQGLMKGIDRFKYRKGFKLSTYVTCWIKQAIQESITRKNKVIYVPYNVIAPVSMVNKRLEIEGKEKFAQIISETAQKFNLAPEKLIEHYERQLDSIISTNQDIAGEDCVFEDLLSDPVEYQPENVFFEEEGNQQVLKLAKQTLTEREYYIIKHRFGLENAEEMSLEVLGEKVGLTKERVRQIQNEALEKLYDFSFHLEDVMEYHKEKDFVGF